MMKWECVKGSGTAPGFPYNYCEKKMKTWIIEIDYTTGLKH